MAERAERVAALAMRLVVQVVLVELRVLPEAGQIAGRHEPAERVEGGDGVTGALLAVIAPGPAGVGLRGVVGVEVRGVVPVTGRHPVVRTFLLARCAELRAAAV